VKLRRIAILVVPIFALAMIPGARLIPLSAHPPEASASTANPAMPNLASASPAASQSTNLPTPNELLKRLGISGYADPLSARPGDTIKFHVSSESPTFHATIVRVFSGDPDPRGPGIVEQVVPTPVNRTYVGRHHDLPVGTYVTVPDNRALRLRGSFTISAWIAPTTIPGSTLNPLAMERTPAGTPRPQGILTKWSDATRTGYGLFIDKDGGLAVWLGAPGGRVEKIGTGVAMHPWDPEQPGFYATSGVIGVTPQMTQPRWYFVAATYDAPAGQVRLYQEPLAPPPDMTAQLPDPTRAIVRKATSIRRLGQNNAPGLTAAYITSNKQVGGFYNGKIDNPRIYDRALTPAEIAAIRDGTSTVSTLANWDFSRQMSTTQSIDVSGHHLNGTTVNLPVRALTGHNWMRQVMDWTRAPSQYGAIEFHEDALADARWPVSFRFKVPSNLPSGYYAAKLETATHVYYVSFFVRPDHPTAKIAFIVPLYSYMAYGQTGPNNLQQLDYSLSQYSRYDDGGGVFYSSRLRPITNMRALATGPPSAPREFGTPWQYESDTHIVYWLHAEGFKVDFYTDQDLNRAGEKLLAAYKVVLTGSHPEYISDNILNALKTYTDSGGRLMYLGGNGFYWVTVPDPTGTFTEVRRHDGTEAWQAAPGEYYHGLTGEMGGLWRFRGRPPNELVATGFTAEGFGAVTGTATYSRPYTRDPGSFDPRAAFVFQGIGPNEEIGHFPSLQLTNGAAGEELDRYDYALNSPPETLVLATASGFGNDYIFVVEEVNGTTNVSTTGGGGQPPNPLVRSDMTLSFLPRGGAVFSVSSISYSGSLPINHNHNNVSRITANVLRAFMSGGPLPGS
jgi:N,N-dimethylformamidase